MNESREIRIDRLGAGGDGLAETPEGRIYVPLTVPGDVVRVCMRGNHGDALLGEAVELLAAGPGRRNPPCPLHAGVGRAGCGGCSLQHLSEPLYRSFKLSLVEEALQRAEVAPGVLAEACFPGEGTRRRAVFSVRRAGRDFRLGFNRAGSRDICDMTVPCRILDPRIAAAVPGLRAAFAPLFRDGEGGDLQVACMAGGLDVVLVRPRALSPMEVSDLAGPIGQLGILRLSFGRDARSAAEPVLVRQPPEIRMGGFSVRPPAGGFRQASDAGEAALVAAVVSGFAGLRRVADLFCGIGTFALPLVAAGMSVLAADSDAAAMEALADAGRRNMLGERLRTVRRNLMQKPLLASELAGVAGAVLDPPRAGAAAQVGEVVKAGIGRVMMVSCNPATFARDAGVLVQAGYRLEKLWPVDQFLYSPHMELAALFVR